jgi:hypothetical protein
MNPLETRVMMMMTRPQATACALQLAQACPGSCCSGEVDITPAAAVDATVTAAEPTSSSDEEQADVASHPLPDMFGAQVRADHQPAANHAVLAYT